MNAEDWHRQSSEWPNSLSLCDLKKNILETNKLGNHPGSPSLWYIRNFFWRWHLFIVHVFKRSWSLLSNEMKPQCIIKLFQQVWRKIPNCMISVLKINLCIDIKLVFFFPLHWLCYTKSWWDAVLCRLIEQWNAELILHIQYSAWTNF